MKDKLQKKDMTFLLALAGFGFLCVLRYYNENMMQHLWALSILGNRRIIQGMTAVFFLILIGVAGHPACRIYLSDDRIFRGSLIVYSNVGKGLV